MSDLRVRLIIDAQNNASPSVNEVRGDVQTLDNQLGTLGNRLNQFLAFKFAEMIAQWGAEIIRTADNYQTLTAKLAMVTDSYEEQVAVQKELFDIAQRSHAGLSRTEDAYIKNADAIRRLGGS
ncbi:MAG: tape measure protein, partial [Methylovulum sp.]|nr:tape measure protein [Methylovulum sp.]